MNIKKKKTLIFFFEINNRIAPAARRTAKCITLVCFIFEGEQKKKKKPCDALFLSDHTKYRHGRTL